jgi:hypothetical protein
VDDFVNENDEDRVSVRVLDISSESEGDIVLEPEVERLSSDVSVWENEALASFESVKEVDPDALRLREEEPELECDCVKLVDLVFSSLSVMVSVVEAD